MRRLNNEEKKCECGCGGYPKLFKSRYIPGHDARDASKKKKMQAGIVLNPPTLNNPCLCGCGLIPKTPGCQYLPGHDHILMLRLARAALAAGLDPA